MTTEENNTTDIPNDISTSEEVKIEQVKTETIGELIRNKREERGLSLKFISQQTKIHIGLLESLENDQIDKLPSHTYVRGFVKATAKLLGLDQNHALNLLEDAYKKNTPNVTPAPENKEIKKETARNTLSPMSDTSLKTVQSVTLSSSLFLIKAAVVLGAIAVIGYNVKNYMANSAKEEEVKLPEVLTALHRKAPPEPKPVPKVEPTEPKVEEPIEVNIIQDKNQKVDVTVNDINLKTISLGEKQFIEQSLSKEKYDEYLPAKYRIDVVPGIETIFLNAVDGDSWLTYKVDDKEIKKFVLRQGRTLFLRGALIRLFIGNTSSLKAFHNNKAVDLSYGSKRTVKNIVLPEKLKTKYLAPLFVFLEDGSVVTSDEYLKSSQAPKTPAATTEAAVNPEQKTKTP